MSTDVFDKTDKGREEIATRVHQLPMRVRTLLLLIDGKHSASAILEKVTGIGITMEHFQQLLGQGFIAPLPATPRIDGGTSPSAPLPLNPPEPLAEEVPLIEGQTQFQAVYRFYTETIRSTLGLRGYMLQLKVEKAASVDELLALREPYLDAVHKAKGKEVARSLRDRLDQLLGLGEAAPHTTIAGAQQASSS